MSQPPWASASDGRKQRSSTKDLSKTVSALTCNDTKIASVAEFANQQSTVELELGVSNTGPLEIEPGKEAQSPTELLSLFHCFHFSLGLGVGRRSVRKAVMSLERTQPFQIALLVVLVFGHGDGGSGVTHGCQSPKAQSQSSRTAPAVVSHSQLLTDTTAAF